MNKYRYYNEKGQHLHELNNKPLIGTSHIGDILAKNLVWWSAELSAVECLEKGEKIPTIREEYERACASDNKKKAIDELQKKYPIFKIARFAHFNKKNEKAEEGTNLHSILEDFVKTGRIGDEKIMPFVEWFKKEVKSVLWSEGHCYSERLWLGGISDLGIELHNGQRGILDYKSSPVAYYNQFLQAAGYAIQVEENGVYDENGNLKLAAGQIDFIGIVPFGGTCIPELEYNVAEFKRSFESAVQITKHLESFNNK